MGASRCASSRPARNPVKGEKRLALEDISRALEIKPDVFDALWIKARIYRALGQLDRAEEDLGRALEMLIACLVNRACANGSASEADMRRTA